ncbi:MAG: YdiU family protein [Caulobacterales bacterium]|nr:YdiU family protein [Caulobacterales bacterium]
MTGEAPSKAPYRADPQILTLAGEDGAPFYDPVEAAEFPKAILRYRNQRWAEKVGLGNLSETEWLVHFARFHPLPDNLEAPLALRYHGHQFRTYNPDIGDGRGFLFAQLRDDQGRLLDLGTKGSGQTPYSRFGDGRLTLKGGVREILATEMLEALGVYTSKTFSLIETGEALYRNDEPSPTRSAVLVRLSHSHVRFGVFQRLAYERNAEAASALIDYCVRQFDRDLDNLPTPEKTAHFFERVVRRTARLAAQWMAAGFVHGVLNTDNMNVTGESFDYGPWRFAPVADPAFTAAYFDETGLYSYARQPEAAAWNLSRLGGCLTSLADTDALNEGLAAFSPAYEDAMGDAIFRRLGLKRAGEDDMGLVAALFEWLAETRAPFEQVFFDWFCGSASQARAQKSPISTRYAEPSFARVKGLILAAEPERPERLSQAYFARREPTTMLIDEVEAIWAPIAESDDWSKLNAKIEDIRQMREAFGFDASTFRLPAA